VEIINAQASFSLLVNCFDTKAHSAPMHNVTTVPTTFMTLPMSHFVESATSGVMILSTYTLNNRTNKHKHTHTHTHIYICRRFAARKRSLNCVEVVISAKLPDNIHAHSSHFRRWDLSRRGGRGGTWW